MRLQRNLLPLLALACLVASACGGGDDDEAAAGTPTATPRADGPVDIGELARSVVQIQALDGFGDLVWTGSGTIVSERGLILTNAHVVDDRYGDYDTLGVAVTERTDQPAELRYYAEIAAVDYALDLAVIEVASGIEGGPVNDEFPAIPLGDSDAVEIGDALRILGYPGIGGETITLTDGVVSGFTSERSVGGRAWIKTNATIAGGNSGGLAVDASGRIVGVPTIAGSGAGADPVDCRYVADTNRDGIIDERDTCVPVGGFINGLRPINLALPLIEAAEGGRRYVSPIEPMPVPGAGFDTSNVYLFNVVFADGVTEDDRPTQVYDAMPSGIQQLCSFWEYEGMQDGMRWEALWFIDGELSEEGSITDTTWVGGESGDWWVCIIDELSGLDDGLYELIISVEGDPFASAAIFVGGEHPPVELEVENLSSFQICYVFISPSGAQNWGFDRLDFDEVIGPGETRTLELLAGTYDILIQDCDQMDLVEEYELEITEDSVYTVTDA
jgi:S1-C subfamily serine protease